MTIALGVLDGILRWYGISLLASLCVWQVLRKIPSVNWGICRLISPWFIAWVNLFPAAIVSKIPFDRLSLAVIAGVLLLPSLRGLLSPKQSFPWKETLQFEAIFLSALLLCGLYIPFQMPVQPVGERLWDTSLWSSVQTQGAYPLDSPWFPGHVLRYHTLGYYALSGIALFTGQSALLSYSFAMAFVFASYLAGLFLIFHSTGFSLWVSSMGALGVAIGSNLKSVFQAFDTLARALPYDWWKVSRVIENTITEFPVWSYTLGDLHPHFMVLPLFTVLLSLVASCLLKNRIGWGDIVLGAILVAWVGGGNGWELPIYVLVFATLILLVRREISKFAWFGVLAVVFMLPFLKYKSSVPLKIGWVKEGSSLRELTEFFGLFLLPLISLLLKEMKRQSWEWWVSFVLLLILSIAMQSAWLFLAGLIFAILVSRRHFQNTAFPTLALLGLAIVLFCETLHFRDSYGEGLARMNTVFKFYMPAWTLLGVTAVLSLKELDHYWKRRAVVVCSSMLAVALSSYLLVGLKARTGGFALASLDPLSVVEIHHSDDARLIRWLNENRATTHGVVLEATGNPYSLYARFGSLTGTRSFLGWENHINLHFPGIEEAYQRGKRVREIFEGKVGSSCEDLRQALRAERIDFVALGHLERSSYGAEGVQKLLNCLSVIHREGETCMLSAG